MKKALIVIAFLLVIGGLAYWTTHRDSSPQAKTATPSSDVQQAVNENVQGLMPKTEEAPTSSQQGAQKPLTTDSSIYEPTVVSTGPANSANDTKPDAAATTTTPATNTKPALPPVEYVEIINNAFAPASITVKIGTVVKWSNNDAAPHLIIADKGPFQSPTLKQTDSFTFTFTQLGEFPYHCGIHTNMKGTVIVTP